MYYELLRDMPALKWLPGKSGSESGSWLPTWVHLMDTAGVMEYLLSSWLPSSAAYASMSDHEDFRRVCCFMALTHDIGKMTPLFAARLVQKMPDIRLKLNECGISSVDLKRYDTHSKNSPHALAGSAILSSLKCNKSIAAVIGAHHGKPQETINIKELLKKQFREYSENYYSYAAEELGYNNYSDSPEGQLWASVWRGWLDFALAEAGYDSVKKLPNLNKPAQVLISGLLITADWIASSTEYFPLISVDDCGEDINFESRFKTAEDKLNFPDLWSSGRFSFSDEDFEDEFSFTPNDVQRALAEAAEDSSRGGIYILEAPMGCGKTEAALAAADILAAKNESGGIFFGLPTQATANGIFGRIMAWAEQQSKDTVEAIRLAHGMAELNDDYRDLFNGHAVTNEDESGGLIAHPWFKGRKQALLANFVIGTVDQLLMAALKQKHVMLRHLGLAGKVVIVDECHAYDAYMNQYLDTAVKWLGAYSVPVIILSATLPSSRRAELIESYISSRCDEFSSDYEDKRESVPDDTSWRTCRAYPLLTWTDGTDVKQKKIPFSADSKKVAIERISEDNLAERVREAISVGGCAGVILNTVARAQSVAQMLREAVPDAEVLLFHSHFTMHDRAERERDLLARIGKDSSERSRRALIVVGTQVLEQSLDIDFDFLATDLCPMDLLLQRLGRLHRHSWRTRPEALRKARCVLLGAIGEELEPGSRKVYGDWPLLMTRSLLPDVITLPDDIADLVQDAYNDKADEADSELKNAHSEYNNKVRDKRQRADTYCLAEPSLNSNDTINGMLNTDASDSEKVGMAAVRDGVMSISVIVMKRYGDGGIGFIPWVDDKTRIDKHSVPHDSAARKMASQRINLPYIFNLGSRYDAVVDELERRTKKQLPEWRKSPWLDGELLLILDENNEAELCGFKLIYDKEQGLIFNIIDKGSDDDE